MKQVQREGAGSKPAHLAAQRDLAATASNVRRSRCTTGGEYIGLDGWCFLAIESPSYLEDRHASVEAHVQEIAAWWLISLLLIMVHQRRTNARLGNIRTNDKSRLLSMLTWTCHPGMLAVKGQIPSRTCSLIALKRMRPTMTTTKKR